jgi:hypothetical protein
MKYGLFRMKYRIFSLKKMFSKSVEDAHPFVSLVMREVNFKNELLNAGGTYEIVKTD